MTKLYNLSARAILFPLLLAGSVAVHAQQVVTVGGTGTAGYNSDGISAKNAHLNNPRSVVVDTNGNIYVSDQQNHRVRRISNTGTITTVAGTGTAGYNGDAQSATSAQLNNPAGLALDASGNLYIADAGNHRIRKITSGTITTIAGTGTGGYNGDNITAPAAQLQNPYGVFVDNSSYVYIADMGNHRVRVINAGTGNIVTIAGTGTSGYNGDNMTATSAQLFNPYSVTVDASGDLYIADYGNYRVRKVSSGTITTVAGTGSFGYGGDYGPATSATVAPVGLAANANVVYIADGLNNRIRKIVSGTIIPVVGNGITGYDGEGQMPWQASLNFPSGVAVGPTGNLYIADIGNNRVRMVTNTWYKDNDIDGFGSLNTLVNGFMSPGAAYVNNSMDCNDSSKNDASWVDVGQPGFSKGTVAYCKMTTDKNGFPLMVYRDNGNGSKASLMSYAGGGWGAVGGEGFSAGTVTYTDVALDAADVPYVVYSDGANSNKATVMKYNGTAWVTVGSAGFTATAAVGTVIALDGRGQPYVAYMDGASKTTVMMYNGANWVLVGSASFSPTLFSPGLDIAIDGAGMPYVIFSDAINSGKATVMRYNGPNWGVVGSAGLSAGSVGSPNISLNENGTPYIAFSDGGVGNKAMVMRYDGSTWVNLNSSGFSAGSAPGISMMLDNSSNVYLAYTDATTSGKASLAKYNSSGVTNIGGAGFSAGAAGYIGLVLDKKGIPYVGFADNSKSDKATVMSVALKPKAPTAPSFSGTNKICNGDPTVLSISGGSLNDASNWQWYSGSCGGTLLTSNTSLAVTPTATTKYFAMAVGPCLTSTAPCDSITVTVDPIVIPSVTLSATPDTNLYWDVPVTFTAHVVNGGPNPTYEWYKGPNKLPSVTGSTYAAGLMQNNDLVCVHVFSDATCAKPTLATACAVIHKDLSVDMLRNVHSLALFPNPNTGSFIVNATLKTSEGVDLEIVNAFGQSVYKEKITARAGSFSKQLDLDKTLAKGIYTVRLSTTDGVSSARMILQ
jgi:hypothetical protein